MAVLFAALVAVLAPPGSAAGPAPTLRLVDAAPLTLHGEHFRGGERVFVTLHTTRPYGRYVTARADGSFTAAFPNATAVCGRVHGSARGASGDRASLVTRRTLCTPEPIHPPLLPNPHG